MKHRPFFLFVCIAALVFGCGQKSQIVNYTGNGPGTLKGKIVLYDTLYDQFAGQPAIVADSSGVLVTLEGTSYSAVTDRHGEWEISNVPSGAYPSLMLTKAGFAQSKISNMSTNIGYSVTGNGTQYINAAMYEISRVSCDIVLRPFEELEKVSNHDSVFTRSDGSTYLGNVFDTLHFPGATFTCRILDNFYGKPIYASTIIYFSKSRSIDPLDPHSFSYYSIINPVNILTGTEDFLIDKTALTDAGFHSGDVIYCVAYAGGRFCEYSSYTDGQTFQTIYSGLSPNHSDIQSFTLP